MCPRKNDLLGDTLVRWCWNARWELACWVLGVGRQLEVKGK